jgi:hypothetical protein
MMMDKRKVTVVDKGGPTDPKGLIFEAYRIDNIIKSDCRTIFLDWALSLPDGKDPIESISILLKEYADMPLNHPMTRVLREGLERVGQPRRRGGWRSRQRK